jgi:hypothetical protein
MFVFFLQCFLERRDISKVLTGSFYPFGGWIILEIPYRL